MIVDGEREREREKRSCASRQRRRLLGKLVRGPGTRLAGGNDDWEEDGDAYRETVPASEEEIMCW
jgi:hypothetical protein